MKKYILLSVGIIIAVHLYGIRKENRDSKRKEIINNLATTSAQNNKSKPWFRNAFYGISVSTPLELKLRTNTVPTGYEEYIKKLVVYGSHEKDRNLITYVTFMQSIYEAYNLKESQESSIGNLVNIANGTDLKLTFREVTNDKDDILCNGTFKVGSVTGVVKSYAYWNGKGKLASVTCIGIGGNRANNEKEFKKIIDSINLAF